ncbi:MAG: hypothetical protein A3I68_05520 [Candidatus Melainabacteria bacterium RIFCSPLOWO2_02_FULL_35_15]|nr:MAG: hypothetical protein A3F80_07830 [Candidatus Melainabacteria bacterium RIFCSPLOWO2_12_FULL_35_11]OGI12903.1 MAG: hypothetical protein A3I68_05520 [Candidatus Melainabacteria bacterium RIFCSPLOWO2_02_FULL_35_15]
MEKKNQDIQWRCYVRLFFLIIFAAIILGLFWFGSRYPQLLEKAAHITTLTPHSFINSMELIPMAEQHSFLSRVFASFVNWIWSMKIGMTLGLTMGALLHTLFEFYPPKLTGNIYLNTLKGIVMGAPAGICVNCAVPVACGITRSKNKIETALGFMFSSPTLNFLVVSMVFASLPLVFGIIHYSLIAVVLLGIVPLLAWLYRKQSPYIEEAGTCAVNLRDSFCKETILESLISVLKTYGKNLMSLFKFAVPMMLVAAIISSVAVELIPFQSIFGHVSFIGLFITALVTVLLPVPIALEVIVAHHLFITHVPAPYVMLFLFTLGTYSMLPMIYLWKEVSKKLALGLYVIFVVLGIIGANLIQLLM